MAQGSGAGTGRKGTTHVSFVCQRCYQPLRLDTSFNNLDKETLKELTGITFSCFFARKLLLICFISLVYRVRQLIEGFWLEL